NSTPGPAKGQPAGGASGKQVVNPQAYWNGDRLARPRAELKGMLDVERKTSPDGDVRADRHRYVRHSERAAYRHLDGGVQRDDGIDGYREALINGEIQCEGRSRRNLDFVGDLSLIVDHLPSQVGHQGRQHLLGVEELVQQIAVEQEGDSRERDRNSRKRGTTHSPALEPVHELRSRRISSVSLGTISKRSPTMP